jgi:hAT family C-terminal dimerisation region
MDVNYVILHVQEPTQNVNTNTLQWWKLNGSHYPGLPNLAVKYLRIPATPTSYEREFSKTGRTEIKLPQSQFENHPLWTSGHVGVLVKKI